MVVNRAVAGVVPPTKCGDRFTEYGDLMELPTHCFDCGVPLAASWTRHLPSCVLVKDKLVDECTCRDQKCGHVASAHGTSGECLICLQGECWC